MSVAGGVKFKMWDTIGTKDLDKFGFVREFQTPFFFTCTQVADVDQIMLTSSKLMTKTSAEQVGAECQIIFELTRGHPPGEWLWSGSPQVSAYQAYELVRSFSESEILCAVKDLKGKGALGPDSFPVFWPVVGQEIMVVIHEFGASNKVSICWNKFYIFLIPRKPSAE